MEQSARRYNTGKPRMSLIPYWVLSEFKEINNADGEYAVRIRNPDLDLAVKYLSKFAMETGGMRDLAYSAAHAAGMLHAYLVGNFEVELGKSPVFGYPYNVLEALGHVYTRGAAKYTDRDESGKVTYDGTFNWAKGMSWISVADSGMRHLTKAYIENLDEESGLPHLAHALWNIVTLATYVKEHPEYDDRRSVILPKVGLDIDGVIADFTGGILKLAKKMKKKLPDDAEQPHAWNHPFYREMFTHTIQNKEFWADLDTLIDPKRLRFEPIVYITSRPVDTKVVEKWLRKKGFPTAPVVNTWGTDDHCKVKACKDNDVPLFIDDRYETFQTLNASGIPCLLMTRSHNQKYNVGSRRITHEFLLETNDKL